MFDDVCDIVGLEANGQLFSKQSTTCSTPADGFKKIQALAFAVPLLLLGERNCRTC